MEIELLKTFQKVAVLGTLTKAANELYLSVSTVTGRIKALEQETGKDLFLRVGRRVELTEAGTRFLGNVERFLRILQEGENKIRNSESVHTGDLNLAVTSVVAGYILPQLLRRFCDTYPFINLNLITCPTHLVMDKVHNCRVDLGIVQEDVLEEGITTRHWFKDEIVAVLPKQHQLSDRTVLQPFDLQSCPILGFACHTPQWDQIKQWFYLGKVQPRVMMEVSQVETLKRLLEQFQAVSFLPRMTVVEDLIEGDLNTVNLKPPLKLDMKISFVFRNNVQVSHTVKTFLEFAYLQVEEVF